ncbi:cysteine synthase [Achromatium sp. WMS2]|nr:cysteine synthase [Achromatium sp. WMS1]KOR29300.1 cysteine synthase [Achromatium sp. WMS2]
MDKLFIRLTDLIPATVHLKLEGYNIAGSIKLKPALQMITALEQEGILNSNSELIESSSGNLGTALAIVSAQRGYRFTCVTDPISSKTNRQLIQAYGGQVLVVQERDDYGGFLQTRLQLIKDMLAKNNQLIWLNQYANKNNYLAHTKTTAPEILQSFPHVDWLFIGAGTTGTLMGCLQYFRQHSPITKIVAVDTEGSVTFGAAAKKRHIPGLGTSRKPEISKLTEVPDITIVPEIETIRICHRYAKQGLLLGGSTGTVLAGLTKYANDIKPNTNVVAIAADLGERYLDTIYNPEWIRKHFDASLYHSLYPNAKTYS